MGGELLVDFRCKSLYNIINIIDCIISKVNSRNGLFFAQILPRPQGGAPGKLQLHQPDRGRDCNSLWGYRLDAYKIREYSRIEDHVVTLSFLLPLLAFYLMVGRAFWVLAIPPPLEIIPHTIKYVCQKEKLKKSVSGTFSLTSGQIS